MVLYSLSVKTWLPYSIYLYSTVCTYFYLSVLFDHCWALCEVFTLNGAFQAAELSYNMREASHGCWPIVPSSSPLCLLNLKAILVHHPFQEEMSHPNEQLLQQAGPHLLCRSCHCQRRQTGRQRGRWVGRLRVRRYEERSPVRSGLWHVSSVQANRDAQSGMSVVPAGASRCFLGIVVPLLW